MVASDVNKHKTRLHVHWMSNFNVSVYTIKLMKGKAPIKDVGPFKFFLGKSTAGKSLLLYFVIVICMYFVISSIVEL